MKNIKFEELEYTPVPGFPGYFINKETTNVGSYIKRNNETDISFKILNISAAKDHYYRTQFIVDEKKVNVTVHRLMAITFIPNPKSKKHVNHIDGNKLNNSLENLEWATPQENAQHAVDTGLTTHKHCEVSIIQCDKDSHTELVTFRSARVAQDQTGIAFQNISKVLRGLRKSAGGFYWKYK